MTICDLLTHQEKLYLAQKFESIYSKSECAEMFGLNKNTYNIKRFKQLTNDEWKERIIAKKTLKAKEDVI